MTIRSRLPTPPCGGIHETRECRHKRREEGLQAALARAGKLGHLIMVPRPLRTTHEAAPAFASTTNSRGVLPAAFSAIKTCLASLLHVLNASHSMLFSSSSQCIKGNKGGRGMGSATKSLINLLDGPPSYQVPVDSASLESILQQACAKEDSSNTDGLAIVGHINNECCDVRGNFDKEDLHHDLCIAEMVAFGYQYWPRNITREEHFQDAVALGWNGALTRCKACIDLVELGSRHGYCNEVEL